MILFMLWHGLYFVLCIWYDYIYIYCGKCGKLRNVLEMYGFMYYLCVYKCTTI